MKFFDCLFPFNVKCYLHVSLPCESLSCLLNMSTGASLKCFTRANITFMLNLFGTIPIKAFDSDAHYLAHFLFREIVLYS